MVKLDKKRIIRAIHDSRIKGTKELYDLTKHGAINEIFAYEMMKELVVNEHMEGLSDQQQVVVKRIIDFITENKNSILIKGYAGTGKTYVIVRLLRIIHELPIDPAICVCAPTNNATDLIYNKIKGVNKNNVDVKTIHKVFGSTMKYNEDGEQEVIIGKMTKKYDLLIIDEASMCDQKIYDAVKASNVKTIYVGDDMQLPPVKETISMVFNDNIETLLMDKIIRQGEGNPIIEFSKKIRTGIETKTQMKLRNEVDDKGQGIMITRDENEFINDYVKSVRKGIDAKMICYTNRNAHSKNNKIRFRIFKGEASKFMTNERIISKKAIYSPKEDKGLVQRCEKRPVTNSSTELTVLDVSERSIVINVKGEIKHFEVYQLLIIEKGVKDSYMIYVAKNPRKVKEALKPLRDVCMERREPNLWKEYYSYVNIFADVDYSYCITTHKSQGKTFDESHVDLIDIKKNRDRDNEMKKMFYTAVTRASNNVKILI